MGIMLETASPRLSEKGMPHYGSPDKIPEVRLDTLRRAGAARVPFTSGILIGIGETRLERIESLLALRAVHAEHGHIQEIIVQNFRAKAGTKMGRAPEPDLDELLWTIAVARIVFGAEMSIQAPPNLSPGVLPQIVAAGINDWGGVSPLTPDFVNPEAPWPHLEELGRETARAGKLLHERLTIYPKYAQRPETWLAEPLRQRGARPDRCIGPAAHRQLVARRNESVRRPTCSTAIRGPERRGSARSRRRSSSARSAARTCPNTKSFACSTRAATISPRSCTRPTRSASRSTATSSATSSIATSTTRTSAISSASSARSRKANCPRTCAAVRTICRSTRFSAARAKAGIAAPPKSACRAASIRTIPATPTSKFCDAVKAAVPDMHVHAFSPLEVWQGAATLGIPLEEFLTRLKAAGLGTLPGTAAEILDDEVRAIICPDKINTAQWFEVMDTAHRVGFKTTATIMYGHVDKPENWARHLLRIRAQQQKTGGFTEFVPLPFVHMEAPMYLKGRARRGPTFREAVLMHAVARLALHPVIPNIQASWVKMGHEGVVACLNAGCNDLGGTLMNESITRAAGAAHGQETSPEEMHAMIAAAQRRPRQRTTTYQDASPERIAAGLGAGDLIEIVNTPLRKRQGRATLIRNGDRDPIVKLG